MVSAERARPLNKNTSSREPVKKAAFVPELLLHPILT
jgi:hypothetical protein